MKRSLRTLETLQAALSSTTTDEAAGGSHPRQLLEERRAKEIARAQQLSKLSPYKRAEYLCLECVAELRSALRDIEELQYTLRGVSPSPSSASNGRSRWDSAGTTSCEAREADGSGDDADAVSDERAQLLGHGSGHARSSNPQRHGSQRQPLHPARRTGEAALLEQELLRARQQARRAHQRLQQLQRDTVRLATSSSPPPRFAASSTATVSVAEHAGGQPTSGAAAAESLDWPRAEKHVELAKLWYREVFGIYTVSSAQTSAGEVTTSGVDGLSSSTTPSSSVLQLNRPAQPHQPAGSMAHFGRGANPLPLGVATAAGGGDGNHTNSTTDWASGEPSSANQDHSEDGGAFDSSTPSQALMLRSARNDAEFQEFFASVQANDDLMDAALDRISEGVARLLDNARGMQDELTIQEELLQGTETRIAENEVALAGMNRRLRRAIRDMHDSSICVYVMCLVLLLLILAVLLRVVK